MIRSALRAPRLRSRWNATELRRGLAVAASRRRRDRSALREKGFTFVELLVVCTILLILASAVMPLAKVTVQRQRETELRRSLREMRTAIDKFKELADNGVIAPS